MSGQLLALAGSRRFFPLLAGLSLGAFGDNLFRNALVILVQFVLIGKLGMTHGGALVVLAPGLFMLPYFLFSGTAGQLADRLDKARLMRWLKFIEIFLMLLAGFALVSEHVPALLGVLFLAGMQSAFYSPVKYAILPQLLGPEDLLAGNALAGAALFLAILLGTIAGGALVLLDQGPWIVAVLMVGVAVLGWITSLFLPSTPAQNPTLRLTRNPLAETGHILKQAFAQPGIPLVIVGKAWFWLLATLYVAQMPGMVHDVLQAEQPVFTLFFTLFSIGIAGGSLLARRLLGDTADARYTAPATLGLALCGIALALTLKTSATGEPLSLGAFLALPTAWIILAELGLLAVCGGLYIVPLNVLLQARADETLRARIIAASNICDSVAMVTASAIGSVLLAAGISIPTIWLLAGLAGFAALPVMAVLMPQVVLKSFCARLLRAAFDVRVEGLENLAKAGPKAVIVANHVSLLDGILLAAFLPGRLLFAVDTHIAQKWWARLFLALVEAYRLDPTQPMALKGLIARVGAGARCVIFPEGRITTTGGLMKINEGPGLIADKAGAPLVPVRIAGAEYTRLSYLKGLVRRRTFPRIRLSVLPPVTFALPAEVSGRQRRQIAAHKLYDLMSTLIFETSLQDQTLVDALLDARALHGPTRPVLEDKDRAPLSYNALVSRMLLLGPRLAALAPRGARIGLMLPSTNAAVVSFFALLHHGRVPAMINFTAGVSNIRAACQLATVSHIVTSRAFLAQARLEPLVEALALHVTFIYLEDLRQTFTVADKVRALVARPFVRRLHQRHHVKPDEAAVVLFTSGSEGAPKGVVLSHRNLLANRWQVSARLDFSPRDTVLNALPLFHAFGLTGGLLIPLLAGARTVLYPSPLHYRIVPLLAYDCSATVLFGTDTFLNGYARTAHPYDFYALRFVCAGAEKVRPETHRLYAERYGVRILEGYGATETAPVIAMNTRMHGRPGTVGRLLPGMKARLTPVPGVETGGRLAVAGPNIMMGYLKVDQPGVLQPPPHDPDGTWHDTGDIVAMDGEGYLVILGRAKRFVKIAGEMVSLGAVEELAQRCWPGFMHAAVALPDPRKGEQIVLATTHPAPQPEELRAQARTEGHTDLMVPKEIHPLSALPLLGTGKTDYVTLQRLINRAYGGASVTDRNGEDPDVPPPSAPAPTP